MKIEDFILQIEEELDALEPGRLTPDSNLDAFALNSINVLIIIALIKTEYDVVVDAEDFAASKTITDVFNIVKKNKK
ncbi:MAG: acyl carrier protein [Bacteroidales bacterium]|nr:acyl carrier protein [Bacteroidales bacterium]